MAQLRDQGSQRRSLNPRDQFGRKWSMEIEIATGDPTGGIFPAGWQDPLHTPMKYCKVPRNADGQSELGRLIVDFDQWITDHTDEEEKWYVQLHANARDLYKRFDANSIADLENDRFLTNITGPKPWPSVEVLRQAKAGHQPYLGLAPLNRNHREALGQLTVEDLRQPVEAVAPVAAPVDESTPPDNYKQFIGWALKHGCKDLKEVSAAWAEFKQHTVAA